MDLGDITGKAKDLVEEHADQIDGAIDKVADLIDGTTGGKFSEKIEGAAEKLKDVLPGGSNG